MLATAATARGIATLSGGVVRGEKGIRWWRSGSGRRGARLGSQALVVGGLAPEDVEDCIRPVRRWRDPGRARQKRRSAVIAPVETGFRLGE